METNKLLFENLTITKHKNNTTLKRLKNILNENC